MKITPEKITEFYPVVDDSGCQRTVNENAIVFQLNGVDFSISNYMTAQKEIYRLKCGYNGYRSEDYDNVYYCYTMGDVLQNVCKYFEYLGQKRKIEDIKKVLEIDQE